MGNVARAHKNGKSSPCATPQLSQDPADDAFVKPFGAQDGSIGINIRERLTQGRSGKDFALMYSRKQDLGEGMTGRVTKLVDRHSRERAMKMSYGHDGTERAQLRELKREVAFLRSLDHPCLTRLIDFFEDGQSLLQVVVEICKGGNLASAAGRSRIRNSEKKTAYVVYQVLLAVNYMHARGIAHRDIKEENIMFVSSDPSSLHVMLIDFGLSTFLGTQGDSLDVRRLHTFCGTLPYMSPEVTLTDYDLQADLWSVGVLAFELLTGSLPFNGDTDKALIKQIRKARIDYSSERWTKLSPCALELVQHLLVINPAKRWDAQLALRSSWFEHCVPAVEDLPIEFENKLVKSIRNFMAFSDLRKLMYVVAAHFQFPLELSNAREMLMVAFMGLDLDRDGALSQLELGYLLEKHGVAEQSQAMFAMADFENFGLISWTIFEAMSLEAFVEPDEKFLGTTFDYLSHGRHHVSIKQVVELCPPHCQNLVADILKRADKDVDGYLEKDEFLALLKI